MRYVVYGAGAVGGVIGGRLHAAGHDVVLIARGAHLAALRKSGLRLQSPQGDATFAVPAVGSPAEAQITSGDAVILAMKTQHTTAAVAELAAVAPDDVAVLCAQNGVENERIAARMFRRVYGLYVFIVASHLGPGVVQYFTEPGSGVLDLGRYPSGSDEFSDDTAAVFRAAGFDSRAQADIMGWKYRKLLANLTSVLQALYAKEGTEALEAIPDLFDAVLQEAVACYRAAAIECVSAEEQDERLAGLFPLGRVHGREFPGGSSWQSLARSSGSIETDYFNGEIALLGRRYGVATLVNELLQGTARRVARTGLEPGSLDPDELRAAAGLESVGGAR